MKKSAIYIIVSAIVGFLGFIGGIIIGASIPTVTISAALKTETSFNVMLMFGSWVSVAILVLILLGIAFALRHLEKLEDDSKHIKAALNDIDNRVLNNTIFLSKLDMPAKSTQDNETTMNSVSASKPTPISKPILKTAPTSKPVFSNSQKPTSSEWQCADCGAIINLCEKACACGCTKGII